MADKKCGKQTIMMSKDVYINSSSCYVGPFEGEGPLKNYYDVIVEDELYGEQTWEKAESRLVKDNFDRIVSKAEKKVSEVDFVLGGDLLNQCIASSFGLKESSVPFIGLYGACSTMAESMALGAMLVDGNFADCVVSLTSSHFCSAEKQYRYPLELGTQRPPTAQWTVTGSGGVLMTACGTAGTDPKVKSVTIGKIVDMGIKDANNMGAAMAPSAADTIKSHLQDTGREPSYYDLIVTGDLGKLGKEILIDLMRLENIDVTSVYDDCGVLVYDLEKQDVHAGGSGCGCSAVVLSGYLLDCMKKGKYSKILFVGTGALLSPTSSQQGQSILGVAHAVDIEM